MNKIINYQQQSPSFFPLANIFIFASFFLTLFSIGGGLIESTPIDGFLEALPENKDTLPFIHSVIYLIRILASVISVIFPFLIASFCLNEISLIYSVNYKGKEKGRVEFINKSMLSIFFPLASASNKITHYTQKFL